MEKHRILIKDCALTLKAMNTCNALNIKFLDELETYSTDEILHFRNVGIKTWRELRKTLRLYGYHFRGDWIPNSEAHKEFADGLPKTIKEIKTSLNELKIKIKDLCDHLEKLHII
jgi:hypothetical protein